MPRKSVSKPKKSVSKPYFCVSKSKINVSDLNISVSLQKISVSKLFVIKEINNFDTLILFENSFFEGFLYCYFLTVVVIFAIRKASGFCITKELIPFATAIEVFAFKVTGGLVISFPG
jgi:hypothetical protein